MIVLGGTNSKELAKKTAYKLKAKYGSLIIDRFPDGELYLRLPFKVSRQKVILIESMHPNPDLSLIETIFAARTCKELS